MTAERACTVKEVLDRLGMSRRTFYRLMAKRELPLVETARLGRKRRFTASSLERLLQSRWSPEARTGT